MHLGTCSAENRHKVVRSDEQERIVEAGLAGGNIGVRAGAGTGKTKELEELAWELTARDWRWRGLYLVYNKSAARDAIPRLPPSVEVRTHHSLAMSQHGRKLGRVTRGPFELQAAVTAFLGLGDGPMARTMVLAVIDTVAAFCASVETRVLPTLVPASYADKVLDPEAVASMAQRVFAEMNKPGGGAVPPTHDAYLRGWQLTSPRLDYATVLFDEFQDANPPTLDVFLRQKCQRIAVGDSAQAIYGFRGAVDGFAAMHATVLTLRQSWRFGPGIATLANSVLAAKGDPFRLIGSPHVQSRVAVNDPALPDAVLARTNFGIVEAAIGLRQRGASIAFAGEAEGLADRMVAAASLYAGHATRHPDFRSFRTWEEFVQFSESDQGKHVSGLVRIVQVYGDETAGVARMIREAGAAPGGKADVTLATFHAFKGAEARHVGFGADLKEFCSYEERDGGGEFVFNHDEANVAYVGITRAIEVLDLAKAAPVVQASLASAMEMREAVRAAAPSG